MRKRNNILKNKRNNVVCDFFYNCSILNKFINILMKSGKKKVAKNILYKSMIYIRTVFKKNPYIVFLKCLKNSESLVEIKRRKVGGSVFSIPVRISNNKALFFSLKNLKKNSILTRKNKLYISLAKEIYNTYKGSSLTIKNRDDIHKLAENNRAFSHFLY